MFKVDNALSKPNIPRTIRFSESIYVALSEMANEENVSFNALVLQCCSYAIEHYEKNGIISVNTKD